MKSALPCAVIALLVAASTPATALSMASQENCHWVGGRLSAYNGTPTFRIWPRGTNRLLGVVSRSGAAEGADVLPPKVRRMRPSFDRNVWGSFRVCPLTADRAGWMRRVIVVDARGLTADER